MNKFHVIEFSDSKNTLFHSLQKIILSALTLIFLIFLPFYFWENFCSSLQCHTVNLNGLKGMDMEKKCDIFRGKWVPYYVKKPYYNETCNLIIDQQNCLKFGRNDTDFLKWRWKPNQCELPLFDTIQFFDLVRGKSIAFVGDSVGRNQMQSLLCLLASVVYPQDLSEKYSSNYENKRYFYKDYNFTIAMYWSPYLVENKDIDPNSHSRNNLMNLYLDKVDENWATNIETFDYVIISAGQWFFRPVVYYENDKIIGCRGCDINNITAMTHYYGYGKAFKTAFKTLLNLKNYKGMTILRTFSPSHFENGDWNKGGNCVRTVPFKSEEMKFDGYMLQFYLTQVEELMAVEKEGRKRGLKFRILETTEAMIMRPDGHPNYYGRAGNKNESLADCVHWCLPGPIDTWNEFLIYLMKMKDYSFFNEKLQGNA